MKMAMVNHPKMEHLRYRCLYILARGERTLKGGEEEDRGDNGGCRLSTRQRRTGQGTKEEI
jgi:hypothetical protein